MVVQQHELEQASREILAHVEMGLSKPIDLIEALTRRGLDEDLVRGTIWFLIDQGKLDLTRDRQLKVVQLV
jgi:hypothetical protein